MLHFLIAEMDLLEQGLAKRLGPGQLLDDFGKKVVREMGDASAYIIIMHQFSEQYPNYVNRQLDVELGYAPGQGPSRNPTFLGKIMGNSCCLVEFDNYNRHFQKTTGQDYDSQLSLQCADGSKKLFKFLSRSLSGFSEGTAGILTVMAPAQVTPPTVEERQPVADPAKAEKYYAIFLKLPVRVQKTMRYIHEGFLIEEIVDKIKRKRPSVNNYIALIKQRYVGLHTHVDISSRYGEFSHLIPVK